MVFRFVGWLVCRLILTYRPTDLPTNLLPFCGTNITAFTLGAYQPGSLPGILKILSLGACLALRCFQRFSVTNVATQQCH